MNIFDKYRAQIDSSLQLSLNEFDSNPILKKACHYALFNGGKRLRPMISLMVAEAINPHVDVTKAALTIEYFHTASLIADDLPCMDNDDFRREQPSLHKVYGETLSLLVTYALIAEGYRNIHLNAQSIKKMGLPFSHLSDQICTFALENATYNTGIHGATGGQILDLVPPDLSLETIKEIIHKKTTSLFEIAFVFGWLYGGGSFEKLTSIKEISKHFGLAFQIADDIMDLEKDEKNEGTINIAHLFGKNFAINLLDTELKSYLKKIASLGITTPELVSLADLINNELFNHHGH